MQDLSFKHECNDAIIVQNMTSQSCATIISNIFQFSTGYNQSEYIMFYMFWVLMVHWGIGKNTHTLKSPDWSAFNRASSSGSFMIPLWEI